MLIGLAPDADYYARVQVFNSAGRGPKGQWRIAKTAKFGKIYTVLPAKIDSDVMFCLQSNQGLLHAS